MKWSVSMPPDSNTSINGAQQKSTLVRPMDSIPITNIPTEMVTWLIPLSLPMTYWQLWPIYGLPCTQAMIFMQSVYSPCIYMTSKFNSSRIRADVAKWFLLAHRTICLSSLDVVLHKMINYRMVYPYLPCHPSIPKICLWHANSLPLLC
jgi:hypothetical protein